MKTRFLADRLDAGIISGASGILDFITGQTGYVANLYVTGADGDWCKVLCSSSVVVGDCAFVVTTGGRVGIGTCYPECDVDIYGNICHSSGNFTNYSGYISGHSGIFDWLSGNSGYMRNAFTVGTGESACVFTVTTGGNIGINTCDPQCDVDIYGNICHTSGNFTNYSGYISGHSGIFDWVSGNTGYMRDEFTVGTGTGAYLLIASGAQVRVSGELWITGSDGAPCQVTCGGGVSECGITDWVEAFDEDGNGDLQPWSGNCINDTAWLLKKNGDLEPRANYFSCCASEDLMMS